MLNLCLNLINRTPQSSHGKQAKVPMEQVNTTKTAAKKAQRPTTWVERATWYRCYAEANWIIQAGARPVGLLFGCTHKG